jgi:hypothetical protein
MIIKTMNQQSTTLAKLTRDLLESNKHEIVYLVPFGVRKICISGEGQYGFSISLMNNKNDLLDEADGFCFAYAWIYAKTIAEEAALSMTSIEFVDMPEELKEMFRTLHGLTNDQVIAEYF